MFYYPYGTVKIVFLTILNLVREINYLAQIIPIHELILRHRGISGIDKDACQEIDP